MDNLMDQNGTPTAHNDNALAYVFWKFKPKTRCEEIMVKQ